MESRDLVKFTFDPVDGLRDKNRFPKQPISEDEARGQFMILFDQIKDYINNNIAAEINALKPLKDSMTVRDGSVFINKPVNVDGVILSNGSNVITRKPRYTWSGNIGSNNTVLVTHNLNTIEPLISWTSNTGNLIVTVKVVDANTLEIGNYSSGGNAATVSVKIF